METKPKEDIPDWPGNYWDPNYWDDLFLKALSEKLRKEDENNAGSFHEMRKK